MNEETRKILLPMIRRILPHAIATELIGVQPMSGPSGLIYSMGGIWVTFEVIDSIELSAGNMWYTVRVNNEIRQWLTDEFVNGPDYVIIDSDGRKNCVDIPERILLLLKLKWAK